MPPGGPAQPWLTCAPDLDALAEAAGIPAAALSDTVVRWNAQAAALRDDDFARGQSAYDGWSGERLHYPGPAATLASPPSFTDVASSELKPLSVITRVIVSDTDTPAWKPTLAVAML